MSEPTTQEERLFVPVETWYAPRLSCELEGPLSPGEHPWHLTIWLHEDLLVHNPHMRLVCGARVFRVIEEREGEMDDGLFGERRRNGREHQSL
jgi:hypothetical protein